MKMNKNIAHLICELEYLIGLQCYNPKSYNGYTGIEGCSFRYPVCFRRGKNGAEIKEWGNIGCYSDTDEGTVSTMKYKFGSNQLYIGKGIEALLKELENRYNLDFNELEKERIASENNLHSEKK